MVTYYFFFIVGYLYLHLKGKRNGGGPNVEEERTHRGSNKSLYSRSLKGKAAGSLLIPPSSQRFTLIFERVHLVKKSALCLESRLANRLFQQSPFMRNSYNRGSHYHGLAVHLIHVSSEIAAVGGNTSFPLRGRTPPFEASRAETRCDMSGRPCTTIRPVRGGLKD